MVEGRATLFMKDPAKEIAVENYRPITCLNLRWKLLTSILAEKTYKHLLQNRLLPVEQKGCRKDLKGTKDQLIIDEMVMKKCKRRKTNLCMTWVDFNKAYDMGTSFLDCGVCLGSRKTSSTCPVFVQDGKKLDTEQEVTGKRSRKEIYFPW